MTSFAILPAAGHSRRMGQPKLLLPVRREPLIQHVLGLWRNTVDHVVVVVRPDDVELAAICANQNVEVVQPTVAPPDMTASVKSGLAHVRDSFSPNDSDCWLLAPADMPQLGEVIITGLLERFQREPGVYVAAFKGKRGHPLIVPWSLASHVERLLPEQTMRDQVELWQPIQVEVDSGGVLVDIDTPQDYQRFLEGQAEKE